MANELDRQTNVSLLGTTRMGKCNLVTSASGGADSANAILIGAGTSADPVSWSTAGKMGIELRSMSTATSGDSRGIYSRHEIGGAGGSGESLRGNTNISAAGATSHGCHASIAFETNGKLTGLGVGVRAGCIIPDRALAAGGSYYGGMSEMYVSGDDSDISSTLR